MSITELWRPYNKVYVLRLGHRPERDKRVTTHVLLVARAFGANGFILADVCDRSVENTLKKVTERWGGKLFFECGVSGKDYARTWKRMGGEIVHLTMYGINVDDIIGAIRSSPLPKLIVVGSEKVERFFYDIADYNVAIGNQPHSEVSALAIFLDRLYRGQELYYEFLDAKLRIVPQERGKKVERIE